ncbi:MAG: amidophosphoribosyltransferase [Deltaproteobacteria bacterium RIFCSPLOWO2_12_FULL_44_12]|nr:MAG: amidophosphoribosyltransferase [Deltaproteobacteria bacterium RIFCSPHIGHO2_01_FULL_43_49]OGQ16403.1 MAG: amidophosphoribosyltransferase [Deltaproteobacteria bacterium RIFCSPHIGHO2_02_FULL_44_53]OGQ27770.1 MAG: amidophosphoribosyltransferase [Deltaproteobacteria bacterium RIFCSPHIGHO2_12_FULL_44_21]OGQ32921.1 MAG: amidophosphoribosyltransferase [Deltaproteobacteria bacterium RIFCSPLOWO2_01_FULL_45_74]OGQ42023.1 MAG: amidophosphoribosyltransferase [Deltaproteobacteria bacterium RIFCSPLOWO
MCGIVGIFNHTEASKLAYLCLYALQHRGQESTGMVTSDGQKLHTFTSMGLVNDCFHEEELKKLKGDHAIGHVRYSTSGTSELKNCQPFVVNFAGGSLAVAHNGNLTNACQLRKKLESEGAIFQSTMDTEVIMHLIAKSNKKELVDKIIDACSQVLGAYSLVFLAKDQLIVVRDSKGFRPLVIGKLGGSYIVASETCALDLVDATFRCEVEPGEVMVIDSHGMRSLKPFQQAAKKAPCIFEYIYFARPDSHIFGRDVYEMRKGFGRQLAREHPVGADLVIPVPDSGVPAAIGYAEQTGISFQMGLIRNHYVGRTFIEPEQSIRHFGVKIKLNPVRELLQGKKVIVVDDSIVRGTTCMKIVKMLREKGGAKEVHMRISSPPIAWPCFYGIDTPRREELIAAHKSVEEIRKFITADSLGYLSFEGLRWFKTLYSGEEFCDACFTGNYTVDLPDTPEIAAMAKRHCTSG